MELLDVAWLEPLLNGGDISLIHDNSSLLNEAASEFYLGLVKLTLLTLRLQMVLSQLLKYQVNMFKMLRKGRRVNHYVVDIDHHEPVNHVLKTVYIKSWNIKGLLASPYGITRYSYCPVLVMKDVFHSSPRQNLTRL